MKTIFLKVTLCVSVFAIATISWLKIQSTDVFSDIQLANIEALANNTESGTQTCTRAVAWASCYDKNGNWAGMRITAVAEYVVSSVVEICEHAHVTSCPGGSM
ncbi:NVEALA domain-containing protein [Bacteroides intestinalis]|jgi:hypothetical protein|uniref:NVEALA domain-containing protein n=1 Tax=Bacteroides intestinalis TaxID=329854 RepID=UPI0018A07A38|nr:NVEALA domain-containing protein [Bacteroides intestinalis]